MLLRACAYCPKNVPEIMRCTSWFTITRKNTTNSAMPAMLMAFMARSDTTFFDSFGTPR